MGRDEMGRDEMAERSDGSPWRPPARIVVVSALLALGAAACGGGDEAVDGPTTTPAPAATVGTTPGTAAPGTVVEVVDEEAEVLAAVRGYWDTWLAANNPPDPDHPDLERYATGSNLARLRESITDHANRGIAFREPPGSQAGHDLVVVEIADDRAVVRDCSHDDWVTEIAETREVVDDSAVTRYLLMTLVREDGRWKVANSVSEATYEGIVPCE